MRRPVVRSLLLTVAGLMISPSTGWSQPTPPSDEAFLKDMRTYFHGEKTEGAGFMAAGAGGFLTAAFLFTFEDGDPYFRGMTIPLVAIGAIQLAVGSAVYFRTDQQIAEIEAQWMQPGGPEAVRASELPRMEVVNFWFDVYRWIEISLFAGGIAMAVVGDEADLPALSGAGVGLGIESLLMLGLDLLAEDRADHYTAALKNIAISAAPLHRDSGWSMAVAGRF